MTDVELVLVGGAVGLVAFALWKYYGQGPQIDPQTGGVVLPAGSVYGPPAPTDVTIIAGQP